LGKFFAPELQFGLRLPATPWVLVPETAMHKYDFAEARKNHVGFAGEIADVQTVAEAHPVYESANHHLRFCILGPHSGHPFASLLF
jgi:hypothetical protein